MVMSDKPKSRFSIEVAYEMFADDVGKSVDDLTRHEKIQAMFLANTRMNEWIERSQDKLYAQENQDT